jgi:hypothetical protein
LNTRTGSTIELINATGGTNGYAATAPWSASTKAIPAGLIVYDIPAQRGTEIRYSLSGIKPGHYALRIFNSVGQLVYQKDMNIQVNFIDDRFVFPAKLPIGNYTLEVFNPFFKIHKAIMVQ